MSAPLATLPPLQPPAPVHEGDNLANICRHIVQAATVDIQGKNYLKIEGWESIAAADHCTPEVVKVECVSVMKFGVEVQGVRAEAILKRDSDGYIISRGYGFVGEDEYTDPGSVDYYAMEAKAQTRAVSRVCRHKYAFVLLLVDKNLQTTPADEVPPAGFFPRGNATQGPPARTRSWTPRPQTQSAPQTPAQTPQAMGTRQPPQSATDTFWDGVIKGVQIKEGTKQTGAQAGEPYQLFIIRLVDGREAVTFDTKLGETCAKAVGYQCSLSVKGSRNRPGKFVAQALLPARNGPVPSDGPVPGEQPLDDEDFNE